MDHVPQRRVGEFVRVMQTTDMEKLGLSNQRSVVRATRGQGGGQECSLSLIGPAGVAEDYWVGGSSLSS